MFVEMKFDKFIQKDGWNPDPSSTVLSCFIMRLGRVFLQCATFKVSQFAIVKVISSLVGCAKLPLRVSNCAELL